MKLGRNDPCWCGSKKKYKKCHLHNEDIPEVMRLKANKVLRDSFSSRYCSAPVEWHDECSGGIVKAHTIPKSGSLRKIADAGHVLSVDFSIPMSENDTAEKILSPTGVQSASTITGFCKSHDCKIFRSIETEAFSLRADQCFYLAYRSIARELFTKKGAVTLKKASAKRLGPGVAEIFSEYGFGLELGLKDIAIRKRAYDDLIIAQEFGSIRAWVVNIDLAPPVMVSGAFCPTEDMAGRLLQDMLDASITPAILCLTSFFGGERGHYVFSWLDDEHDVCMPLVRQLNDLFDEDLQCAIVHLIFCQFENFHVSPSWWEGVPQKNRSWLLQSHEDVDSPFKGNELGYLSRFKAIENLPKILDRCTVGFSF